MTTIDDPTSGFVLEVEPSVVGKVALMATIRGDRKPSTRILLSPDAASDLARKLEALAQLLRKSPSLMLDAVAEYRPWPPEPDE